MGLKRKRKQKPARVLTRRFVEDSRREGDGKEKEQERKGQAREERSSDWLSRLEKPAWLLNRPALCSVLHCAPSEPELSLNEFLENPATTSFDSIATIDRSIDFTNPPRQSALSSIPVHFPSDCYLELFVNAHPCCLRFFVFSSSLSSWSSTSTTSFCSRTRRNQRSNRRRNYAYGRTRVAVFGLGR